jgi:hypothetical protein
MLYLFLDIALDPTSSINPFLEAVLDPAISKIQTFLETVRFRHYL